MPASLSQPAAPKLERVTTKLLDEWASLDDRRKQLNRETAAMEKRQKQIEQAVAACVASESKGKVREIRKCGYRLSIVTLPGFPAWKSLFAKLLGDEAVAKATAEAPPREKVAIEKL
jgi:hypothetical protein